MVGRKSGCEQIMTSQAKMCMECKECLRQQAPKVSHGEAVSCTPTSRRQTYWEEEENT